VLRAQAADVREAGKRRLLEAGGRKEIAMMVANVRASLSYLRHMGGSCAAQHDVVPTRPMVEEPICSLKRFSVLR
jgi:hypothetical protein